MADDASFFNSSVTSAERQVKKKEIKSKPNRGINYCVLYGHKPTKVMNDDTQIVKNFIKLI